LGVRIISNIGIRIDPAPIMSRLHITEHDDDYERLMQLIGEASSIADPKALYKVSYIDEKGEDYVVTERVTLKSKVLRTNLNDVFKIFPYAATCGLELDEWSKGIKDILERYWGDCIKEYYLGETLKFLLDTVQTEQGVKKTARMNPGSLKDWPLAQQKQLFTILGDTESLIGVRLTESSLMLPTKSVSGIFFPTETSYENCQLCPRENCPNRRAEYNKALEEQYK
jgi:hypothetical protein